MPIIMPLILPWHYYERLWNYCELIWFHVNEICFLFTFMMHMKSNTFISLIIAYYIHKLALNFSSEVIILGTRGSTWATI